MNTPLNDALKPCDQLTMARIESRVERLPEAGCWIWMGATTNAGYGKISVLGKLQLAHRASYLASSGGIDDSLMVCHVCDVRSCVNPNHLYQGTQLQNVADAINRMKFAFGGKNGWSKLTEENVLEIRKMISNGIKMLDIAEHFKVSRHCIKDIKSSKRWSWLKKSEAFK